MQRDSRRLPGGPQDLAGAPASRSTSAPAARTPAGRACARSWKARSPATTRPDRPRIRVRPRSAYLRGRGFTDATIEAHQLGWAPAGWDALSASSRRSGRSRRPSCPRSGYASPRQRGGVYDRFRERIIFPIRDANGHAVGPRWSRLPALSLTAEAAPEATPEDPTGPKYLNSPATPLFDKSRTLYLIDRAKSAIRKTGQAVIVEGYTDALMAHQAGLRQRRRVAGHGADARAGRGPDPLREADRPRLRRRSGRPEGRQLRGDRAQRADPRGPAGRRRRLDRRRAWSSLPEGKDPTRSSASRPIGGARRSGRPSRSSPT